MRSRKLLQQAFVFIPIILLLTGCGEVQAEPTATFTAVPLTATLTPVPPTVAPTNEPTPTATPEPFAIQNRAFEAEYESHKEDCDPEVDVEIFLGGNDELFFLLGEKMIIPLRGSIFVLWCYSAEHTWIGEATYAGYTFASDEDNPLRFRVDEDAGYLYVSGEGTVALPDGTLVTLPR